MASTADVHVTTATKLNLIYYCFLALLADSCNQRGERSECPHPSRRINIQSQHENQPNVRTRWVYILFIPRKHLTGPSADLPCQRVIPKLVSALLRLTQMFWISSYEPDDEDAYR